MKKNSSSQLLWNFIRQKGTHTKRNLNFTIYYSLKLLVIREVGEHLLL